MDENEEREGRLVGRIPEDTFGHRLMLVRADAGNLTIEQAAKQAGLLSQSWGNWERGRMPRDRVDVVDAVVEAFGTDRAWLLDGGPLTRPSRKPRVRLASFRSPIRPSVRRPRRVDGMRRRIAA